MAKKTTLPEFQRGLNEMIRGLVPSAASTMRDRMFDVRKRAERAIEGTPLGRALWGARAKPDAPGLFLNITETKTGATKIGLVLRGLAAMQETGGKTKPHTIRPRRGDFLVFDVGGATVFAREVEHPGSEIAKRPVASSTFDKALPGIELAVANGVERLAERVL